MRRPGLYIHVPFCARVCPYCDFAVLVGDEARRTSYVESLIEEIALWGASAPSELTGFDTLYFGGGTPSLLEEEQLRRIVRAVERELRIEMDPWVQLEANPEDVTRERLAVWRRLGVRTLSLGVQSFEADELSFLGRLHTPEQAHRSVELAREAEFETVSLDLIYGLPGQTTEDWRRNLEIATSLFPDHLSCYQLTVHEKTAFGSRLRTGRFQELSEEGQADLFQLTHSFLADHGLPAYEVSNFSRSHEHRSPHNTKYWDHTPYLGLGPSAHSFSGVSRWWNLRAESRWAAELTAGVPPVEGREELTPEDLIRERVLLAMRTVEGLDLEALETYDARAQIDPAVLDGLVERRLVTFDERVVRPTSAGLAVADTVAAALAP